MNEAQQAAVELIQLKAKLYDMQEEVRGYVEVLNAIAKRVDFKGQSLSELVLHVPEKEVEVETVDE